MNTVEDDVDPELQRFVLGTQHECAACSETLEVVDETVCVTVVTLINDGFSTQAYPLITDEQDFLYEPRFLEYVCWEDVLDEIKDIVEDVPPIIADGALAYCCACESSILAGEVTGLVTKGELQFSPRMPEGMATVTFDPQDPNPDLVCIVCLKRLSDDHLDLWESVEQGEECDEGTHIRCWRFGCPGRAACLLGKT